MIAMELTDSPKSLFEFAATCTTLWEVVQESQPKPPVLITACYNSPATRSQFQDIVIGPGDRALVWNLVSYLLIEVKHELSEHEDRLRYGLLPSHGSTTCLGKHPNHDISLFHLKPLGQARIQNYYWPGECLDLYLLRHMILSLFDDCMFPLKELLWKKVRIPDQDFVITDGIMVVAAPFDRQNSAILSNSAAIRDKTDFRLLFRSLKYFGQAGLNTLTTEVPRYLVSDVNTESYFIYRVCVFALLTRAVEMAFLDIEEPTIAEHLTSWFSEIPKDEFATTDAFRMLKTVVIRHSGQEPLSLMLELGKLTSLIHVFIFQTSEHSVGEDGNDDDVNPWKDINFLSRLRTLYISSLAVPVPLGKFQSFLQRVGFIDPCLTLRSQSICGQAPLFDWNTGLSLAYFNHDDQQIIMCSRDPATHVYARAWQCLEKSVSYRILMLNNIIISC